MQLALRARVPSRAWKLREHAVREWRHGARDRSPATPSVNLTINGNGQGLGASRTLSLHGTGPGGIAMQSNFTACGGAVGHCQ